MTLDAGIKTTSDAPNSEDWSLHKEGEKRLVSSIEIITWRRDESGSFERREKRGIAHGDRADAMPLAWVF